MSNNLLSLFILCLATCAQAQPSRSVNTFARVSLAEKPCTITGTLQGYDPTVDSFKFCKIIYNHLYKFNQQTHIGEISADGKFAITFPLIRPQELMFEVGEDMVMFYGVPGTPLHVTIDLQKLKAISKLPYAEQLAIPDPLTYTGPFAQLNATLTAFRPVIYAISQYKEHNKMIDSLDQLPYKAYRLGKMQRMLDSLATFNNRNNTSSEFRQLMTHYIRYSAAEDLLRYRWLHGMDKKGKSKTVLTPEYLTFLDELPVDQDEALITAAYSSFLGEYMSMKQNTGSRCYPCMTDTLAFLKRLPDSEQGLANEVRKVLPIPKVQRTPEQQLVIDSFAKAHHSAFQEFAAFRAILNTADSILLPLSSSKGKDIIAARLVQSNLYAYRLPFENEDIQRITRQMTDKDLINQVNLDNEQLRDVVAGKVTRKTNLRTSLEITSDNFFDELMKPYKGKVVYIDFWAPWCGPCMGGMPYSKELQQALKGKDVVFLYIGISCTKDSWEKTIKDRDITGEHYYANDNDGKLLSAKFNISGIPHYILVDKQGKVADGRAAGPSAKRTLIKKIEGLLNK